ncbi:ATP-binding cassette domain-containing protein [Falsiroseomonas sp.]|uniref:ATP-binding cassette domain-containing protein n=1 Tax=Falsiroseomonas sp. TaxID=2870721 RepID=UPI0027350907|nr:ATP-binding cassette domain-containing protein [Falsiroseomonas sp.]MDP3415861.1 ATP-binding cassette domain-containing protein [Falsiroseomonas sp.]
MDAFVPPGLPGPPDPSFQQPPRSLAETGAFWLLEAGEADIFAAQGGLEAWAPGQAPPGPHLFVGRIGPGTLVVGHGPDLECLVLRPAAGARLRRLPQLAALGGHQAQVEAMQLWAAALAGGLGARLWRPSNIDKVARPGRRLHLAERQSATARGQGVWLELPPGCGMLLGLEPVGGLLPLPPEGWLVAGVELDALVLSAPPPSLMAAAEEGITAFTDACVAMLPSLRSLAEIDEGGRLGQRAQQDAEAAQRTTDLAAALLHAPAPQVAAKPVEAGPAEPLFQAMVTVAKAARMRPRIQRPTRLREQDIDTPPTMDEIARASGLRLRPVGLPAEWWRRNLGPLLGHLEGEPVALLPRKGGYVLQGFDMPAQPVNAALADRLAPRAWTMIEPLSDQQLTVTDLGRFVLPNRGDRGLALGAALLGAFLGLGMPIAMSFATGSLIPGGNRMGLVELGIALACVGLANFVVQMAGDIAKHRLTATAEAPLHAGLWDRLLRLPMPVLRKFTPSEISSRLNVALSLPLGVQGFRLSVMGYGAALATSMAMLFLYHPIGALVALALLGVQIGIAVAGGILKSRVQQTGQQLSGAADSLAIEAVGGITKLRLAGVEHRLLGAWAERFVGMRRTKLVEEHIDTWLASAAAFLSFFGVGLLFLLFMSGAEAPNNAAVVGFLMAFMIANGAANGLGQAFTGFYPLYAMRSYALPMLQAQPEPTAGRIDPGRLTGRIAMTNVAFGYEGADTPLFSGLNLSIEPGEFVAIVGRSGCGKSTLVRLLLGLERARFGSVTFDRQDLVSLDLGLLRRRIGTVLQGAQLPPGALLDVLRGFSEATEAQIWQALAAAAIAEDVRAMPLGLRTPIADAAHVLSGGQVQRLLLARALVNKPDVLILDEATSALDPATQAVTTRTLASLTCTRIVIAHRLETIRGADRILVIERGKVAHAGSFEELVARGVLDGGAELRAA